MRTILLASPVVLCLAIGASPAVGAEVTQYGGVVNYLESSGSVTINGVPVAEFSAGEGGSGGEFVSATDWLINGTNEIVLTLEPATDKGWAKLELAQDDADNVVLTLELKQQGEANETLEIDGLPDWSWTRATPQGDAADGLMDSVTRFHAAFSRADMDEIATTSGPFLADQGLLGGLDEAIFREELGPLLKDAKLADLPDLTIASHMDGKLFHVTDPEGEPPVNLEFEDEGMSGAVRAGEWWSFIDGNWQVVR